MLTQSYRHTWSLKAALVIGAGVGFGDVDQPTTGFSQLTTVNDIIPRFPALQYEFVLWDTAGTVTASTAIVQALQPDGTWQTVSGQISGATGVASGIITIPLAAASEPKSVAFNLFGPFIDVRVKLLTIATGGSINALISKWG